MNLSSSYPTRSGLLAAALLACLTSTPLSAASAGDPLKWEYGPYAGALAKAREQGSPLLVYFWRDGSEMCGRLYTESLAAEDSSEVLDGYVCYSAKLDDETGAKVFQHFGVQTMPTVLMLNSDGAVEDGIIGYIDGEGFRKEVARIRSGVDTVPAWREKVAENPKDLELAYKLALKLQDLGDSDGHDEIIERIRKKDPKSRTLTGADVAWRSTMKQILKATNDPKEADIAPMYAFLEKCTHDDVLFTGWDWVSRMEYSKGNREAMRLAARRAWKHIPEDKVMDWGNETALKAYGMREELSPR